MKNKKILVVDDVKEYCDFFKDYLEGREFSIDAAYDGLEAKELLECGKYDYIFFDCNMPELSGIELVKVIDKTNPEAKKIMISGYEGIDEKFAKTIGVDIFLSKPLSVKDIKRIVNE